MSRFSSRWSLAGKIRSRKRRRVRLRLGSIVAKVRPVLALAAGGTIRLEDPRAGLFQVAEEFAIDSGPDEIGARKANETVMFTFLTLQRSRAAIFSAVPPVGEVNSCSHRRPRDCGNEPDRN